MAPNRDRTRLRRLCRIAVSLIVMTTAMATRQARAQSWQSNLEVPPSAFFGGIGFGINRVNFGHQSLYAVGTSKNYADGNLVSIGSAGGPGSVDPSNATTASPELRFGYYHRIGTSPWPWGFKVSYADLQADETSITRLMERMEAPLHQHGEGLNTLGKGQLVPAHIHNELLCLGSKVKCDLPQLPRCHSVDFCGYRVAY